MWRKWWLRKTFRDSKPELLTSCIVLCVLSILQFSGKQTDKQTLTHIVKHTYKDTHTVQEMFTHVNLHTHTHTPCPHVGPWNTHRYTYTQTHTHTDTQIDWQTAYIFETLYLPKQQTLKKKKTPLLVLQTVALLLVILQTVSQQRSVWCHYHPHCRQHPWWMLSRYSP